MNEETIKALFQHALEMTPDARGAFLDRACEGDDAAREELEALLRDHEAAGDFLCDPTGGGFPVAPKAGFAEGSVIGPYTLVERLGEGGFGMVYVAQQSKPVRRRVALKVIKAGMDTHEVVTRFEAEKQALALMNHPHIARVFDAGSTPGGRPYFVMELVKGVPIQQYCDKSRLPLRARLDLFVKVCNAVQHAHHKGIIHRDLKPSNILVAMQDGKPVPKVIDFGVAKATGVQLTEATFHTRFAQIIGTPQYMSPEQAEMSALGIDTRSDIYSLGVVLYELLTGTTPFTLEEMKKATFDELRHMIREQDPPTPSARLVRLNGNGRKVARARRIDLRRLAKLVHGELDWIVMKALEKDRTRRYETASGLADDVARYLANRPVAAGPPSVAYRARKFARRNRVSLTIGAVLFVALVSAGWVYLDRAAERRGIENAIRSSLADAALSLEAGNLEATRAAVQRAEGLVAAGKADAELGSEVRGWRTDLDMLTALDKARMARAVVKDDIFDRARGARAYREAFRAYGAAVDDAAAAACIRDSRIREDLVVALEDWIDSGMGPAVPPSTQDGGSASMARRQKRGELPWALLDAVDPDPWRKRLRAAARAGDGETLRALAADPAVQEQRPTTRTMLAHALARNDDVALAVEILCSAQEAHPGDFWLNHDLGTQLLQYDPSRLRDAIGYYRAAIAIRADSPGALVNLGLAQEEAGDLEAAERNYRKALKLKPDYVSAGVGVATVLQERGEMDAALEQFRETVRRAPKSAWAKAVLAEAYQLRGRYDEAIRWYRAAAAADPESPFYLTNIGVLLGRNKGDWKEARAAFQEALDRDSEHAPAVAGLGNALRELGEFRAALKHLRRAVKLAPNDPSMINDLGLGLDDAGDPQAAEEQYRKALAIDDRMAEARNNLGRIRFEAGDVEGALEHFLVAVDVEPDNPMWLTNLGSAYDRMGEHDKALAEYVRALKADPGNSTAHNHLGVYYGRQGKLEDALRHFKKAVEFDPDAGGRHYNLGLVYERLSRIDEAIESFRAATEARQPAPEAWSSLAYALKGRDGPAAAIEPLRKAIEHEPDNATYRLKLGFCYAGTRDLRRAAEAFRKARELGHPDSHIALTQTLRALGDHEATRRAFEAWIEAQPGNAIAHYNLGVLYMTVPDYEKAARCFAESARLDPEHAESWCNLGICLYELGKTDEAVKKLHQALAVDPNLPQAHDKLSRHYRHEAKDPEKALVHYRHLARAQPGNLDYQWLLAEVLLEAGRIEEAATQWGKALALCPNHAANHDRAARALLAAPKLPEAAARKAVQFARRAAELEPDESSYGATLAAARKLAQ